MEGKKFMQSGHRNRVEDMREIRVVEDHADGHVVVHLCDGTVLAVQGTAELILPHLHGDGRA